MMPAGNVPVIQGAHASATEVSGIGHIIGDFLGALLVCTNSCNPGLTKIMSAVYYDNLRAKDLQFSFRYVVYTLPGGL